MHIPIVTVNRMLIINSTLSVNNRIDVTLLTSIHVVTIFQSHRVQWMIDLFARVPIQYQHVQ
jgi:hypothetical protein